MKFDTYLTEGMQEAAREVTPDPALRTRVLAQARAAKPSRLTRRTRVVATLAAVLCLATGAALANSPVVSLVSGWMPDASYTSIADEARMEAKLGYDVRLPEALTEDFTLTEYEVEPVSMRDSANHEVGSYLTLCATYRKGDERVYLNAARTEDEPASDTLSDKTLVETREVDGVTVTYREIPTACRPADSTEDFTAEQYAAEERGEMFLSVGSAEYEETIYQTARFELDGVAYSIGMHDSMADWSAEDFFTAAQTVIEAE